MVFILWNYVLPHFKLMLSPWLESMLCLIVGIIDCHPAPKLLLSRLRSYNLPMSSFKSLLSCISCHCNKSHKLPFSVASLTSHAPLEYLYANVWGPSPVPSVDGYQYYVLLVDHFTKYCRFYHMHNKSDVSSIFVQFTVMVENQFSEKIKKIYSDNGGEFIKLRPLLAAHGISHFTTTSHTPQQNGTIERRHQHIVEMGMTLLHHASAPSTYWTYALATTVYLINCLPTLLHLRQSPFEVLFGQVPDHHKLRTFGCQCYPWLVPYCANKFQLKSQPCVFLGYSLTQHVFQCLDIHTGKLYLSRHVTFDENIFPLTKATTFAPTVATTPCPAHSSPSPVHPVCMVPSDDISVTPIAPDAMETLTSSPTLGMTSSSPTSNPSFSESSLPIAPAPLTRTHPMVTQA